MDLPSTLIPMRTMTWDEVFASWRDREASNPGWTEVAKSKGWPDWESWRRYSAEQMLADRLDWSLYLITDPNAFIPDLLVGPYTGWQKHCLKPNQTTFRELLTPGSPGAEVFRGNKGVQRTLRGLPFSTEFIGLQRGDTGQIVDIDGHHRAAAITVSVLDGPAIDWSQSLLTIALATLPASEVHRFDDALTLGSANPVAPKP